MNGLDILALARDLPDAATFERVLLDTLVRTIGCEAGFVATKAGPPTTVALDPARLADAITDDAYAAEMMPLKAHALGHGGVVVDTTAVGEKYVRRTRYFRELAAPIRGRHSLLALGLLRGEHVATVMLGRTGSTFDEGEERTMRELLPAITLARASYGRTHVPSPLERDDGSPASEGAALVVRDRNGFREMVSRGASDFVWTRARIDAPDVSGWPYTDLLLLAAVRARRLSRALLVGAGGGVLAHGLARLRPGITIDVVDPDATVVHLARRHFALGDVPGCQVHVDSGLPFLERAAEGTWDAILVDAYDGAELPTDFATPRLFRALRRALRPGGAASMNVVGNLGPRGPVRDVVRAAEAHLDGVEIVPVMAKNEIALVSSLRNVVVVGSRT